MKRILLSTAAILPALIAGCSPTYYVPNTHNVPLLDKQGDFRAAVMVESKDAKAAELQASYAVSDNVGIMLDAYTHFTANDENGNGGSGSLVEAGIGYFTPLAADNNIIFEIYGLGSVGSVENHFPSPAGSAAATGNISARAVKFGLQPSLGYKTPYFEAAASLQLSGLSFADASGDLTYDGEDQDEYLNGKGTMLLIEPAVTLRGGMENFKIQFQYIYSHNATDPNFRQGKDAVSIGVIYMFDKE